MNRTRIEWCDYSWGPITGCKHGCWYCYAKKLTQRFPKNFPNGFEPTFYPERLKEPWNLKKPSKIFVCSISDLFGAWIPQGWRDQVLESIEKCPVKHTFILLTKAPENILKTVRWARFPDNVWVGATVTTYNDIAKIEALKQVSARIKFISFEPLLGPIIHPDRPGGIKDIYLLQGLQWIIIGKLTGSRKVKLQRSWVIDLLEEARFFKIPVFLKDNLGWSEQRREWPE
ncbi:MAG: phage Gp37/Gp68 family protein [Nitrospirota bacterium]|nr:phage Gp37/Gp68 family protein [Nitrospirota bacterium]